MPLERDGRKVFRPGHSLLVFHFKSTKTVPFELEVLTGVVAFVYEFQFRQFQFVRIFVTQNGKTLLELHLVQPHLKQGSLILALFQNGLVKKTNVQNTGFETVAFLLYIDHIIPDLILHLLLFKPDLLKLEEDRYCITDHLPSLQCDIGPVRSP